MEAIVVESEAIARLTNGAITAALKCSDRKSNADEPKQQRWMLQLGRLCRREAGVGSGVAEAMNHEYTASRMDVERLELR
jgi:hypothetical protein